jgi:hypothetical protein
MYVILSSRHFMTLVMLSLARSLLCRLYQVKESCMMCERIMKKNVENERKKNSSKNGMVVVTGLCLFLDSCYNVFTSMSNMRLYHIQYRLNTTNTVKKHCKSSISNFSL